MPREYRRWSSEEIALLIRMAKGGWSIRAMAARLHRSEQSVQNAASVHGATRQTRQKGRHDGWLRNWHGRGWSDGEIARKLGISTECVRGWRRRLGLPANGLGSSRFRHRCKERAQREGWGVQMRREVWAVRAAQAGWPQAKSAYEVRVLDLLVDGPKTRRQLAAAIGLSARGTYLCAQLKTLAHRGLVVIVGRAATRTNPAAIWALAPGVQRHVGTRERGDGHQRSEGHERSEASLNGEFVPRTIREPEPKRMCV